MTLAEARKRFNVLREIRRSASNPKLLIEQELNSKGALSHRGGPLLPQQVINLRQPWRISIDLLW